MCLSLTDLVTVTNLFYFLGSSIVLTNLTCSVLVKTGDGGFLNFPMPVLSCSGMQEKVSNVTCIYDWVGNAV